MVQSLQPIDVEIKVAINQLFHEFVSFDRTSFNIFHKNLYLADGKLRIVSLFFVYVYLKYTNH